MTGFGSSLGCAFHAQQGNGDKPGWAVIGSASRARGGGDMGGGGRTRSEVGDSETIAPRPGAGPGRPFPWLR